MIVYFSFDDAVHLQYYKIYESLFIDRRRTNPNLSPYRMTMFVSHEYTDYHLLSLLHNLGHEAACHTVNHINLPELKRKRKMKKEVGDQVKNINKLAGVPSGEIRGFRAPFLSFTTSLYPILKRYGLHYDSSQTALKPTKPVYNDYYGMWKVPMCVYYLNGIPCAMLDGCRPENEEVAFKFIWTSFQRHYVKKIPFGINMHAALFLGWDFTLTAMHTFLDRLDEMDDVWVVPMYKMIQWMETPTTLSGIHTFPPFVR